MLLLQNTHSIGKSTLLFILKLLLLMWLVKCIFLIYNYKLSDGWALTLANVWPVLLWSLLYDAFILCIINLPLLAFLMAPPKAFQSVLLNKTVAITVAILNAFVLVLNIADIFYFRFHLQRADADLLYVLRNPFSNSTATPFLLFLLVVSVFLLIGATIYRTILKVLSLAKVAKKSVLLLVLPVLFVAFFLISGTEKMLPTFGLTRVQAAQLPLVQNSFHTLVYSLYRKNEVMLPAKNYMPAAEKESLFSIHKANDVTASTAKNIVLFIMESVPADFFSK